jgi:hypothetical protein
MPLSPTFASYNAVGTVGRLRGRPAVVDDRDGD